ncbi:hypothetical protein L798_11750 [Zootermopsis nevadensis]|uniref:Uncharacterized protein n=1 Tax=Zootermopsis nevadensis TaxID=136037 RepID=A0A067QWC3_ZOONE|nr:hypothetical protein L798_11750 [Zootermopsis nevadensis]
MSSSNNEFNQTKTSFTAQNDLFYNTLHLRAIHSSALFALPFHTLTSYTTLKADCQSAFKRIQQCLCNNANQQTQQCKHNDKRNKVYATMSINRRNNVNTTMPDTTMSL